MTCIFNKDHQKKRKERAKRKSSPFFRPWPCPIFSDNIQK